MAEIWPNLEDFIAWLKKYKLVSGDHYSNRTIKSYSYFYRHLLSVAPTLRNLRASAVVGKDFSSAEREILIRETIATITQKNYAEYGYFVKKYLKYLGFTDDVIDFNIKRVPRRRSSDKTIQERVLEETDVEKIIQNTSELENKLIIRLLCETALRASELLSIHFENIFFDENRILIVKGKGGFNRNVFFHDATKELLREYIQENKIEGGRIFKMSYYQLWKRIRRICVNAIGKTVSPHFFRHTALTLLAKHGADPYEVKDYGGHKSLRMSEYYTHLAGKKAKDAFSHMPDLGE